MRKIKSSPPEPPLGLDMPFDEALKRFIGTNPKEVEESIGRAKKKKPPGNKAKPKSPGGNNQSETVVSLRSRRVRKRNTGL
jgi:hypothetical protein